MSLSLDCFILPIVKTVGGYVAGICCVGAWGPEENQGTGSSSESKRHVRDAWEMNAASQRLVR